MRVVRCAVLAPRREREVTDREAESVVAAEPVGERPDLRGGDVDDSAAVLAHHGYRAVPDPAIAGGSVSEVYVVDQPDALEVRQHPVQRGAVDIGMARRELVDGDPAGRAVEILEQRSSGAGDATARHAEALERLFEADLR